MLGTVYAFRENPFPGTINDWLWLCKSCGDERWSWTTRHGTSPHMGTKDFYKFMNAGIHGVPTIAFLVLITLFSILIGPVNYVYLSRKKMLWLLLFTVPVMAVTTSLLLLGYSVAVHGFSIKSRIRSLTVLDQRNQTAVTMARLALFAGVAPFGRDAVLSGNGRLPRHPDDKRADRRIRRLDPNAKSRFRLAAGTHANAVLHSPQCRAKVPRRAQVGRG